nr:RNA-binding cell elongation regulator Jag/EloR [Aggregatilinea lenta]
MSETRSVETTGADIETAIEQGLKELGVSRESVIVEILEEPSRGLLGLGARQARIRLTTAAPARDTAPAAPAAAPAPARPAPAPEPPAPRAERPRPAPVDEFSEDDDTSSIPASMTPASEDELDDDARVGMATLQELLEKMEIDATVVVYRAQAEQGEQAPWVLQIQGDDLGTLIGRRGETLTALQYITRLIASRELQRRTNIVIDVEGYKARREEMLRRLAQRMAQQAIDLSRTVALEPMPPTSDASCIWSCAATRTSPQRAWAKAITAR